MASLAKTFVVTVMAMLKAVFSTVFTFDRHQALYRSAVLMIIFTVRFCHWLALLAVPHVLP